MNAGVVCGEASISRHRIEDARVVPPRRPLSWPADVTTSG